MITIPGRPIGKERPRLSMRGRTAVIYTPEHTRAYEETVGICARTAYHRPLKGWLKVIIRAYLDPERRQKYMKKSGVISSTKMRVPDLDNVIKAILDGMSKIVYVDDQQVKQIVAEMIYDSEERAEVEITEMEAI